MSGGNGPTDVGGGGDFQGGTLDTDRFSRTGGNQLTTSDLTKDSALTESWRKLAFQLQPSQGPGSGQIDPSSVNNDAQWMRVFSLTVYKSGSANATGTPQGTNQNAGIELASLRCVFNINCTTVNTPNILYARVYNLSPQTMAKVIEFTRVQVSAGYRYSNYGKIFDGQVIQYRRGKENPVDNYIEIHASDNDDALNAAVINDVAPANTKKADILQKYNKAKQDLDAEFKVDYQDKTLYQQHIQRTRYLVGQVRSLERDMMQAENAEHYMGTNGYVMIDKGGYRPGEAVILSPKTGLVGLPEVTPQGIQAKCLLNPRIRLGGLVKIDTSVLSGVAYTPGTSATVDKNGNIVAGQPTGGIVTTRGQQFESAWTSPIGLYKVLLMNYNGDTRGNPWYNDLIMVAMGTDNKMITRANPANAFSRSVVSGG